MKIGLIDYGYKNKPFRAHYNDAGGDVYTEEKITIEPNSTVKVPLKFGLALPDGFMAIIMPRSSMASKGIVSELPPIDSGYNGEIHAILTKHTTKNVEIEADSRIAQIVIIPIILPEFVPIEQLKGEEQRSNNGFGSTGV